jgi:hypothetical protein
MVVLIDIVITTCSVNLEYFEKCVEHAYHSAKQCTNLRIGIHVIDFSQETNTVIEDYINTLSFDVNYYKRPQAGLCSNLNFAFEKLNKRKYIIYLNDDAFVHPNFVENAIMIMENNMDIGFAGGVQQKGGWLESIDDYTIPVPDLFKIDDIVDLRVLQWEFSACIYRVQAIKEAGEKDVFFDPTGYLSDNEWLIRVQQEQWRTIRYGGMTYWHGKGITQSRYRQPWSGIDTIRERGIAYIKEKWGVNLNNQNEITVDDCYKKEFSLGLG